MNTNYQEDPKFTAYAFNEMSETEAQQFKQELLDAGISAESIENEVQHIQQLGRTLQTEFSKDDQVRVSSEIRQVIMQPTDQKSSIRKWLMGALAGSSVAILATITLLKTTDHKVIREQTKSPLNTTVAKVDRALELEKDSADMAFAPQVNSQPSTVTPEAKQAKVDSRGRTNMAKLSRSKAKKMAPTALGYGLADQEGLHMELKGGSGLIAPVPAQEKFNREAYDKIDTNPYTLVSNQPLSTFSVDVDTASYANMRRFLLKGQMPPKDSLRVEELINYFHYENKFEFDKHPVAIKVQQANSIWNKGRKIVKVALQADSPSNLTQARKNLVFLMDVSGSMSQAKKLPLLKESMKLLMRKLKPSDTISLVVYAGAAGVVLEPTEAKESVKILRALDNLNAGGSTNGGAGIKAAYKMAKQAFIKDGVNRVILATDGDFNVGTSSQSELIELVEAKAKEDIFLTVVGLGMGNFQDALLEKISNRGNGNYAYIDSLSEANKLFNIDLEKNLTTVAKDVKVQIEFNPNLVQAYRLIGYENRMLAAQDFNNDQKDAGEMGAGHTVTALYEIVPVGEKFEGTAKVDDLKYAKKTKATSNKEELLNVKVRYKAPTGTKSTKFEIPLKNKSNEFKHMDSDFKFATAVASFGMKLRNDKLVQELRYRDIENIAKESKGKDQYDFREEFLEMINLAKQIDK